jgi:hypothetical protein
MFAVEDGYRDVLCADGAVVTAQLVKRFGKTVRLWSTRADAERDGRGVFAKPRVVEVDEKGRALA